MFIIKQKVGPSHIWIYVCLSLCMDASTVFTYILQMDQDVLGREAKTVFRDRKSGKKRNLAEEAKQKAEENAEKAKTAEIYSRWGKG